MTLPFTLPDWLPWWVPILLLVPATLYALALLFMPFSVIGVKGRLEAIEARLDEIQHEIRSLSLRIPEPSRAIDFEDVYSPDITGRRDAEPEDRRMPARPPIPPASHELDGDEMPARQSFGRAAQRSEPRGRTEPRFDRFR